jgi:uncharacterized protein (TIGR04255 family)
MNVTEPQTTANRTGVLQSSPLTHVLASVRFAPWPLIVQKINEIQDELRDITPQMRRIEMRPVGNEGDGRGDPIRAWMLLSADGSYGVQFSGDQFFAFTTKYSRYAQFEEMLRKALTVLQKQMRFMDVMQNGVRYVDLIKARANESIQDYIAPALLSPRLNGFDAVGGTVTGIYKSGENELRVRCISQQGSPSVPEDLIAVQTIIAPQPASVQIPLLGPQSLILDFDSYRRYPQMQRMNSEQILTELRTLHTEANQAFRNPELCTDHAFKVWKGVE